ncbi:acetoacetate--CoA ligase [Janthinobacterium sp. PC23-8]|uniref:acetoacetate--CoA ligase n=1 Tax=Janthinobacterium sp. PC23-8 TaxID=2012679 RepID=UPI000B95E353|nr:acetoacetate--CoA ligase [Janthinobacterium sp. PC23-8]OYO26338.1 acetoacetate--CoA ligase [Janthinobacterium sp. PC23-8]
MIQEGDLLWTPGEPFAQASQLTAYMRWLAQERKLAFDDYGALRQWSVDHLDDFWSSIWDYFEIHSITPYQRVLDTHQMPGCKWFEGSRVNYAEHILRAERGAAADKVALYFASESTPLQTMSWHELGRQVRQLATQLRARGVVAGDCVVSYMPNTPQTLIAFLASAAIGAVWSSSAPEFGVQTVLDRFAQIRPKVLFACDGYRFNGKEFSRESEVRDLAAQLPSVEQVVCVPILQARRTDALVAHGVLWSDLFQGKDVPADAFEYEYVPFDHTLWVLFSSGTTGLPKAIAQSHVGILAEHYKLVCLHMDLTPASVMFFYSSTGWMMWNVVVSSLLSGAAIVLYDGSPMHPDQHRLWQIAQDAGVTYFGASAAFLQIMRKNGVVPKDHFQLKIRATLTGGSPVGAELFAWFYENVARDCWFSSQSGGTETCSCLVTAVPTQPVYAGEIQARALGIDLQSWNDDGQAMVGEVGELVIRKPFPSMPLRFWNDAGDRRYREAYFDVFPGVWRHGDFIKINARGGCFIYGRSDSTLNRFGVRIGTAEVYQALEKMPELADSLVVCCELPGGAFFMPLFVVLKAGATLNQALIERINTQLKHEASPRHVPDKIYAIDAVPYTLTGKKMEVPVRKLLMGLPLEKIASRDAMSNPAAIDYFIRFGQEARDYDRRGALAL